MVRFLVCCVAAYPSPSSKSKHCVAASPTHHCVHAVPGKRGKDSSAKLSKLLEQAVYSIDSLLMGCVGAY